MAWRALLGYAGPMSLKAIITMLRRHDLFAGLASARLEVIAFTAERAVFEPGELIFEAGEEGLDAFLILEGEAQMVLRHPDGKMETARVDAGDLIGEAVLIAPELAGTLRRSDMRAVKRIEALVISRYLFQRLMQEFPEMAGAVAGALAQRLMGTQQEMNQLAERLQAIAGQRNDDRETDLGHE